VTLLNVYGPTLIEIEKVSLVISMVFRSVRRRPRRGVRKNRQEHWLESFAVSDQRPRSSTRGGLSCLPGRNYNTSEPPRGLPASPPFATTSTTIATGSQTQSPPSTDTPFSVGPREIDSPTPIYVHLVLRAHLINSTVSTWRGIADYQPGIDFDVGSDSRFTVHHFTRIWLQHADARYERKSVFRNFPVLSSLADL
jgi:hypothetical protein